MVEKRKHNSSTDSQNKQKTSFTLRGKSSLIELLHKTIGRRTSFDCSFHLFI